MQTFRVFGFLVLQTAYSLVLKHVVWTPRNGETFDPLAKPEWLSDYRKQQLEVEFDRFPGRIEPSPDGRVWISFDESLTQSEPWRQFLAGYPHLEARFMGRRLLIKGIAGDDAEIDPGADSISEENVV